MIFEDDVPTVSLDIEQSAGVRAWVHDRGAWGVPVVTSPRLSRFDQARLRLSRLLEELANWVMP